MDVETYEDMRFEITVDSKKIFGEDIYLRHFLSSCE